MSRGPSMTALLGLLAVAGYQNRDKISEWLGGGGGQGAAPAGASPGTVPATVPSAGSRPSGLDSFLPSDGGGGLGTMIHNGLSELVDSFKQSGQGHVADSWVNQGPNKDIAAPDLEQAIGHDNLNELQTKTGLSRDEILSRLQRELPSAVDKYTPDGRLPGLS